MMRQLHQQAVLGRDSHSLMRQLEVVALEEVEIVIVGQWRHAEEQDGGEEEIELGERLDMMLGALCIRRYGDQNEDKWRKTWLGKFKAKIKIYEISL